MEQIKPVLYYLSSNGFMVSAGEEPNKYASVPGKWIEIYREASANTNGVIRFNATSFTAFGFGEQSYFLKAAAEILQCFEMHHANISNMQKPVAAIIYVKGGEVLSVGSNSANFTYCVVDHDVYQTAPEPLDAAGITEWSLPDCVFEEADTYIETLLLPSEQKEQDCVGKTKTN
jgi:hypothetical protein